uniref:VM domain-containing protein n=1 Tax=Caenorhabditis tropicalis TaxID=1561998 RepID=A0A1I7U468_9PELO
MIARLAIAALFVSSSFACLPGLGGLGGGCGGAASPCAAPPIPPPVACGGGCGAAPYPAGPMAASYLAPAAIAPPPPPPQQAVIGVGAQPAIYSAPLPAGNAYVGQGK